MSRPSLVLVVAIALVLALAAAASATSVRIRVEGKTRTIFGATEPRASAGNALEVLAAASRAGEFYYHVAETSFGPYVDQVGLYPATGTSGWAYKVNGASPPVGADKYLLHDGDRVLWYWATFGSKGGPETLVLKRTKRACYRVLAQDDAGKTTPALGAVLHVGGKRSVRTQRATAGAIGCVGRHPGQLVRATLPGAVRSNALP